MGAGWGGEVRLAGPFKGFQAPPPEQVECLKEFEQGVFLSNLQVPLTSLRISRKKRRFKFTEGLLCAS